MRDVGLDLIQVYLFVSPQKKKNEKTRVQKKHRCKVVRKLKRKDKTRQDKTRHRNIASTIVWHAVSKKTLVEA